MDNDWIWVLMELYQALWLSADFENDLAAEYPQEFRYLKTNPEKIPMEKLNKMSAFMHAHPVFN